jgi:hypothetical protein
MRRSLLLLFVAGCTVDQTAAKPGDDLSVSSLADLSLSPLADLAGAAARDLRGVMDIAAAYPAGPYGHNVGDTITPLVWEGYSDPLADAVATSKTYGSYSMDDLRRSGRPYAAIHASAFF